jgi:phage gpG-like protein
MFDLDVTGETALTARLSALPDAVQAAVKDRLAQLADALLAHVVQDKLSGQVLQAKSGALRNSIVLEMTDDGQQVTVRLFSRGDVKYAAIQEFGGRTTPHDIVPNKAKALAFLGKGGLTFAKVVHHPGSTIPARPFMRPALSEMGPMIASELKAAATAAAGG